MENIISEKTNLYKKITKIRRAPFSPQTGKKLMTEEEFMDLIQGKVFIEEKLDGGTYLSGYFYTRHPFIGISDAIVEFALLLGVVYSLVDVINADEGSIGILITFVVVLTVEKLITIYHSNHFIREFIPEEKNIKLVN